MKKISKLGVRKLPKLWLSKFKNLFFIHGLHQAFIYERTNMGCILKNLSPSVLFQNAVMMGKIPRGDGMILFKKWKKFHDLKF